ncbi:5-formyltetrahydrofolate cyclo-ligase [Aliidiomarina minuta]|uniref:5-formyltetrahydrofolate cyclo-ligase n=1 Tax=Aliidiomarina minuta TaxID=880057 RepID=A0A432W4K3_9GAMM|nr:5-formyltetrahydrofolate cyclo-ligase [Aliidiomarina minuta]RUO24431.1 5-formyltetrahydrofolate cyclo-ligase [Aliidiomarina minuta]
MNSATRIQNSRQQLREQLKQQRRALTEAEQKSASLQLVDTAMQQPEVAQAETIALYFSFAAELNTAPLLQALLDAGKKVCLPVLHPFAKGHLLMLRYDPQRPLINNKFAIPEPPLRCPDVVPFAQLDTLLVPLVGFDSQGNRLGMGGGFYDRTLAGWHAGRYPQLKVMGLAHDCQQAGHIPVQSWDVPLPAVITATRCWRFRHSSL